jgi:hypothetical protein
VCAIEKANAGWIRGEKITIHPVEHTEIEVVNTIGADKKKKQQQP